MTAPEDRIYCEDPFCDGDHTFHGERCEDLAREAVENEREDEPEHGPDPASWWTPGAWPKCSCGFDPHDNGALTQHWRSQGFEVVEQGGQLTTRTLDPWTEPHPTDCLYCETGEPMVHTYQPPEPPC